MVLLFLYHYLIPFGNLNNQKFLGFINNNNNNNSNNNSNNSDNNNYDDNINNNNNNNIMIINQKIQIVLLF